MCCSCRLAVHDFYTGFVIAMNFIKKTTARQLALAKKKSMVNLTVYVCFIPMWRTVKIMLLLILYISVLRFQFAF